MKKKSATSEKSTIRKPKSQENDRITYSEGVTVDIGDYEKRNVMISFSTDVRLTDGENPKKAMTRAKKTVQKQLKVAEKRIRQNSQESVDHETMERLNYYTDDEG